MIKKIPLLFLLLALSAFGPSAFATVVDDFSGNLDAYTKSVILTNSGDDETTSLTMTSYSIVDGELNFGSSVTNSKAYQTTFLRDDYALGVGERLQIDLTSVAQAANSSGSSFGLSVGGQKSYTFGQPRENVMSITIANYISSSRMKAFRFNGTDFAEVYNDYATLSTMTGLFIDRLDTDIYSIGYMEESGETTVLPMFEYTGGANAIGFYSDSRDSNPVFVTADNLAIVDSPKEYGPMPGVAPVAYYDTSGVQEGYPIENSFDADTFLNGKVYPQSFTVITDDTPLDDTITGHVIYDLGSAVDLESLTLWSRNASFHVAAENIKVFGFADDNPMNILGSIDDIENDPNIVELYSGTLEDVVDGLSQDIWLDDTFTGQYIGIRADSSYGEGNFQIGEVRFNAAVPEEEPVPGDANNDGQVDGSDVTILAGNWQVGVGGVGGASWEMGDFNGDGAVDGSDVTILAGNWQYGVTTAAASVPEPSTLVLLLAVLASLFVVRRR